MNTAYAIGYVIFLIVLCVRNARDAGVLTVEDVFGCAILSVGYPILLALLIFGPHWQKFETCVTSAGETVIWRRRKKEGSP